MENKGKTFTAKKLTLEEIEALPKASVIWMSWHTISDGIIWYEVEPLMVAVPGKDGLLIGGDKESSWDCDIDSKLFNDPYSAYWDSEPNKCQLLPGITRKEYETMQMPDDRIVFPTLATAITSRGITFDKFCKLAGLNEKRFYKAITGKREFVVWELGAIRTALHMTDDETRDIFFPELAENVYDIKTGHLIEPDKLSQI